VAFAGRCFIEEIPRYIKELPWWKRIFVSKKLLPLFLTQDDLLQHRRYNVELRPIVIDNSFLSRIPHKK
jgi:hypothetical protein